MIGLQQTYKKGNYVAAIKELESSNEFLCNIIKLYLNNLIYFY